MICYADRTYCPFWNDCKRGSDCRRALTEAVKDRANKSGLPICVYVDKPQCIQEKRRVNNDGNLFSGQS